MNASTSHTDYRQLHQRSITDREGFWLETAAELDWDSSPTAAVDASNAPLYRWFPDGQLNLCHNALDRHIAAGRGDCTALIYDSAVTEGSRSYTYAELRDEVATAAGALAGLGVSPGDRVLLYLPMIPQAVIAMLACARLGAVHSVVFGGFAAKEIAARIDDAAPDTVITATGGIEPTRRIEYLPKVAEAVQLAQHGVRDVVVVDREGFETSLDSAAATTSATSPAVQWHDWHQLTTQAEPADPVTVDATHPLYILYTSGTTGKPKGVVRDQGGTAAALQWTMPSIFDVGPDEVILCASDVGWVVGHSYIVYAPLLAGATSVLYEGKPVGTPDAGAFWRMVEQHKIKSLFTAPTALRAIRKADPEASLVADYDISSLQYLFSAGERLDPETQRWIGQALDVPVIDNWWQTETGWPIAANPVGIQQLPVKEGSATLPMVGYEVEVLDPMGEPLPAGQEGNIAIKLPLPPGTLHSLWGDDDRYVDAYLSAFEGYYTTGDSGYIDQDGYIYVMGRTDDVINVSGHRLSTGEIEAAVAEHPAVAECAVIGLADELKGQRPAGFLVLKSGAEIDHQRLREELVAHVRATIGPVADFKEVSVVEALPKTRSGKILRKTMRQIADGQDYTVPSTIEDPAVIDALLPVLRGSAGAK
ncbi:propionyl-CoA synthetase [Nesterenkonia sp. MY13]|uniref:Propionyl-CoA synthetase n=1 Tax=Nesterenkonia sedimenti TaxID=1463632 RepID=A0A7X8THD3_9MICC|nr:acetate--CoA ligase [Nesterenkonia sedimenti]NLS08430.1 propionyl-CoA synthetase [Nesterenkonia sedimenti]